MKSLHTTYRQWTSKDIKSTRPLQSDELIKGYQ